MSEPAKKLEKEPHEDVLVCPLCHGRGLAPREEASRYLAENLGSGPGAPGPKTGEDQKAATGAGGHAQQVRTYPSAEILWRRSPKE